MKVFSEATMRLIYAAAADEKKQPKQPHRRRRPIKEPSRSRILLKAR